MEKTLRRGTMPVVILRDMVPFPSVNQQMDMVRSMSIKAVRKAIDSNKEVFIAMQKDSSVDMPTADDIYSEGVIAVVKQVLKHPISGNMRINVECICRAGISAVSDNDGMFTGFVSEIEENPVASAKERQAYRCSLREALEEYASSGDAKVNIKQLMDITRKPESVLTFGGMIDAVAHGFAFKGDKRQHLVAQGDHGIRCEILAAMIRSEAASNKLQREIEARVQENIDKNQKEYYLREQLKVISEQLGDGDSPLQDADAFREQIAQRDLPEEVAQGLHKACDKLAKLPSGSHEGSVERNYIESCLALPWGVFTKDKLDVEAAARKLDKEHYGMEKVKERILEFIAVRALAPDIKGQIICLVGPPGVGKTSIARSVADALGRKYCRIALGGIHDEADIRGHRKTYIGAMPGRIANALKLAGTCNPLILLDEVDKLASDFRGDPTSALLEVLDPEQNCAFHDHYIDLPIDLSNVMFITTANDQSRIPSALIDRMEVISLPSYTLEEKQSIAKRHLVKKQLVRHGLNGRQLRISDKALSLLIDGYTKEAGVRNLEREIASICRKAAKKIASGECEAVSVTDKSLPDLLGPVKFKPEKAEKQLDVGTVNGLAWTSVGGTMLSVEIAVMDGTGKLELTGSLGDVMRESARTAVSHVRFRAAQLGIDPDFYKNKDIHIHAPEGATPKDGPSAGITMATALISALTGIPVRGDVAMTGEITLRGKVLAIGGLREKSMAAYTAGIKRVILPDDNYPEVARLSEAVREAIEFIPASELDTVLKNALVTMPAAPYKANIEDKEQHKSAIDSSHAFVPQVGGNHETGESRV